MAYRWQPRPDPGLEPELAPVFGDQVAAETWLAQHFEELVDLGVRAVSLVEGDRVVYGPMSLSE